jgi:hypothetical protein
MFWFLSRIVAMILKTNQSISVIKNDDIFIALVFLIFFVLDIKEEVFNRRNK